MLRIAAALLLLSTPATAAPNRDGYAACLLGTSLWNFATYDVPMAEAFDYSIKVCAAAAPEDAVQVEDDVIHLIDNRIAPAFMEDAAEAGVPLTPPENVF
jgi:hypothetical protein